MPRVTLRHSRGMNSRATHLVEERIVMKLQCGHPHYTNFVHFAINLVYIRGKSLNILKKDNKKNEKDKRFLRFIKR